MRQVLATMAAVRSGSARARGPREIAVPGSPRSRGGGVRTPWGGVVGCGFRGGGCVRPSARVLRTAPEARREAPEAPPMSQTEGGFRKGGPAPPCTGGEGGFRKGGPAPPCTGGEGGFRK